MSSPPRKHFSSYSDLREKFSTTAYADRFGEVNLDVDAISRLTGEAREEAVEVLREEVGGPLPDPEAVYALEKMSGGRKGKQDQAALLAVLKAQGADRAKLGAIRILAGWPGPEVAAALVDMLADRGEYVAQTAYEALCTRLAVDGSVHTRIGRLSALLDSPLDMQRQPAVEELQAFFQASAAGEAAAPEAFPHFRSAAFLTFQRSVFGDLQTGEKPVGPIDAAAFQSLEGEDRAWGEQWIVGLLVDGDARGFEFVRKLRPAWAIPALEELSKRKSSAGRKSAAALRILRGGRPSE